MTHRRSKIMVPVCAVQPVAFIEIHNIGDVRQEVARPRHISITELDVDFILSCDSGSQPRSSRNDEGIYHRLAFISIDTLMGQIHIDPPRVLAITGYGWQLPGGSRRRRFAGGSIFEIVMAMAPGVAVASGMAVNSVGASVGAKAGVSVGSGLGRARG